MPKKKQEAPEDIHGSDNPKRTTIERKSPMQWMSLLQQVKEVHWRRLRVTVQVRHWLMAGKPAHLDAADAMIKARGLGDVVEARLIEITDPKEREALAEEVKYEGLCEFHRREGKPGIWLPTNNIKAGLKENWSVLGQRMKERGSRGAMAEGMFVYSVHDDTVDPAERDWVYLGKEPAGTWTAVSHTTGPNGPVSSIKRHEYVERPLVTFEIAIEAGNNAPKLSDEGMAKTLYHFGEHGLGACRSQGYGRFDVVSIEEVGVAEAAVETHAA